MIKKIVKNLKKINKSYNSEYQTHKKRDQCISQ